MSSTELDLIDRQRIEAHIASARPRYSTTLYLAGGGFIRRWSPDRAEALAQHASDRDDERRLSVITFDHLTEADIAVDFPPHGKTAEQLKAQCDEALDQMFERWLGAETRH